MPFVQAISDHHRGSPVVGAAAVKPVATAKNEPALGARKPEGGISALIEGARAVD